MSATVLLLEDESLIAMDMTLTLEDAGFTVLGPFRTAKDARNAMDGETPALAVLDINLGEGRTSFDLARDLADRNVPIVFLTGYTAATVPIPDELSNSTRLMKPVRDKQLIETAASLTAP